MNDTFSSVVPIDLDLGWRFTPNVYFGFLGGFGIPMFTDQACPASASCSGLFIRVGLDLHYRFSPHGAVDPWVGVGVGYEVLGSTVNAGGTEEESSASGLEFVNLQLGADFLVINSVRMGPYGRVSIVQYMSSIQGSGGDPEPIENKAVHSWLELGLRVAFEP